MQQEGQGSAGTFKQVASSSECVTSVVLNAPGDKCGKGVGSNRLTKSVAKCHAVISCVCQ